MMCKTVLYTALIGLGLVWGTSAVAQSGREDMTRIVHAELLQCRFGEAGALHKIRKYRLDVAITMQPDTLFLSCMSAYKELYAATPEPQRAIVFSSAFYQAAVPVAQYYRMPAYAQLLIEHRDRLHPRPPEPDLKHNDGESHTGHHHE